MLTYNVVLNCLKPEKKLLWGIRNIFWRKTKRSGFFSHKMINKGIENYLLKKKTPKENLSQSNAAILKLWRPYVYHWFINCAITLLTKRALKSVELIELYLLFFTLTYQTLSPVRRTFVFLGSRCAQPLTPLNAYALRYEFTKWRTGQRGK